MRSQREKSITSSGVRARCTQPYPTWIASGANIAMQPTSTPPMAGFTQRGPVSRRKSFCAPSRPRA